MSSQATATVPADFRVAVIGGGMSGMLMGKKLKDAGVDFTIYEKADEVGGTWRDNTYPGLSCDVPAHYYSYAFEPNPDWKFRFARGPEIQTYMQHVASKYGLREYTRFNAEVHKARHDGTRWQLETADGQQDQADVIVAATGVLHHPRMPDIPGLDSFAGASFHSARWDHSVALQNKRIGVIGAGSTAVQIVTELGTRGHDLLSFQRTPQWIFPMPDRSYSAAERGLVRFWPKLSNLVHRGYELAFEHFFAQAVIKPGWRRKFIEMAVRRNLDSIRDPELREKLTPPDNPMCKRMIMSGKYYDAVQKDNVQVVADAIDKVVPEGVVTRDGQLHELDVLVLATGFHAHDYMRPMELETSQGARLSEAWARKPKAYRTIAVPGFPNFFMVQGPKSPIGNFSLISIAQTQTDYIMNCIDLLQRGEVDNLTPRADVAEELEETLNSSMTDTVWVSGCQSWYLDADGVPDTWPSTPARFREYLSKPRLEEYAPNA